MSKVPIEAVFSSWEAELYQSCTKIGGSYHLVDSLYHNERADFADYNPDLVAHRIYLKDKPYTVLDVGIGTGAEVIVPLRLYNKFDRMPDCYYGTNVTTPPDFRLTTDFMQKDFPTAPFVYLSPFFMEQGFQPESVSVLLASRVLEWSADPTAWLTEAYKALSPGGIAILHSAKVLPRVNDMKLQAAIEAAGISVFACENAPDLDPFTDVCRTYLYKPQEGSTMDFPTWVNTHPHTFETHFNRLRMT